MHAKHMAYHKVSPDPSLLLKLISLVPFLTSLKKMATREDRIAYVVGLCPACSHWKVLGLA